MDQDNQKLVFLLVDDHDTILFGVEQLIKPEFRKAKILHAENTEKALQLCISQNISVAVVDMSYKNEKNDAGLQFIKKIKTINKNIRTIVYSGFIENYISDLIPIEPDALVSKNDGNTSLIFALKEVLNERTPFYSKEIEDFFEYKKKKENPEIYITPSEKKVLKLFRKHLSIKETAKELYVSQNTVNTHKKHLFAKFKVNKISKLLEKTKDMFLD